MFDTGASCGTDNVQRFKFDTNNTTASTIRVNVSAN
jgi:hypothetical protein